MKKLNFLLNHILRPLDSLLDHLTSYKLVLYYLYVVLGWSFIASLLNQVSYKWYDILLSAAVIVIACRGSNILISKKLNISKNQESDLITALILILILSPTHNIWHLLVLIIASLVAMLSKYVLVINRWHIFNPAALGAFISGAIFHQDASWWVGTSFITPVVFIGGMLILRKMKRFAMVITFEVIALCIIAFNTYLNQSSSAIGHNLWFALIATPLLFFGYIMLTEPFTSPRQLSNQLPYAAVVGFLYAYIKIGISPAEALLIGNSFTYLIEPNSRLPLKFLRKIPEAFGIESYIFSGKEGFKYMPGQYMEWTLSQHDTDFRGNRRYLTISSSPTEQELMITIKIPEKPSAFKRRLESFKKGDVILADGLTGEFILPKSEKQKLAFLAGGVGITPFRSMIKYALDFKQERDMHLVYSAAKDSEFAFRELFSEAKDTGLQTSYVTERLDKNKLKELVPDFNERMFYISGPLGFVKSMENNLLELEVPPAQIKTDFFPGYSS
jgi:ferredoxin-NADP reductase